MLIQEITEFEKIEYEKLVTVAKDTVKAEAAEVRAGYVKNESLKLVVKDGITFPEAEKIILSRSSGKLLPQDVVHLQDGSVRTVAEIGENPQWYDKQYCADPIETEEGTSRAMVFINEDTRNPLIHSYLHDGIDYFLQIKDAFVIQDLKNRGSALPVEVWGKAIKDVRLCKEEKERVCDYLKKGGAEHPSRITSDYKKFLKTSNAEGEAKEGWERIEKVAGDKHIIHNVSQDINGVVTETENALINVPGKWTYGNYGGALCMVCIDDPGGKARGIGGVNPPSKAAIKFYNDKSLLLRVEQSAVFFIEKEDNNGVKIPVHVKVPSIIIKHLMTHPEPIAPRVSGLLSHPILDLNGRLICDEGLDESTGIWLDYGGFQFDSDLESEQMDIKDHVDFLFNTLFSEFIFRDEHSKHLALAMLLTGIQRKILDIAPAFMVVANVQGSGKTSLCRVIHSVITGHDMAVNSLDASSTEVHKELISILKQSPEMVCFDNIEDGTEINESLLSRVITSEFYAGRLLGGNQEVRLPTNSLLTFTGNNVSLANDLVRRILSIRLTADRERPEERIYEHNDILQRCLNVRADVIYACLQVIGDYVKAGSPEDLKRHGSSGFPQWDKMVRFPILRATGVDVWDSMTRNREESTENRSMVGVVNCLHEIYGEKSFTSTKLLRQLKEDPTSDNKCDDYLRECLGNLSIKALENTRSLTAQLKKLDGRLFGGLKLTYQPGQSRKGGHYVIREISK